MVLGFRRRRAPIVKRIARRRIEGEVKNFDTAKGITATTATGTIFNDSLLLIGQSTTGSTRVGRKITLVSVMMKGQYILPGTTTAADGSESFRLILYLDRQANGATAAVTDILQTAVFNAFRNIANTGRFRILHDRQVTLNSAAGNGTSSMEAQRSFSIFKKLNLDIDYSAGVGVITELRSNNIGVLVISQAAKGQVAYTARVRFTDK